MFAATIYHPTSPPSQRLNCSSLVPFSFRNTHLSKSYTSYAFAACFIASKCFGPEIALIACRRLYISSVRQSP
jgi:hypothetical protein